MNARLNHHHHNAWILWHIARSYRSISSNNAYSSRINRNMELKWIGILGANHNRSYRTPSTTEVLYGVTLKRLERRKGKNTQDEDVEEQGDTVEYGIKTLLSRFQALKASSSSSFAENILLMMDFKCNPDNVKQNNLLKGTLILPHRVTSKCRVLVFAKDETALKAKAAGAETVGGEELVQQIIEGKVEFDKIIAAPNMMPIVTKAARVLGPKGLMPTLKAGTLTDNIPETLGKIANAVSYAYDKATSVISVPSALMDSESDVIKMNVISVLKQMSSYSKGSRKNPFIETVHMKFEGFPDPPLLIKDSELPAQH